MISPNKRVERTGGSRLAQLQFERQRRLPPVAHAGRSASSFMNAHTLRRKLTGLCICLLVTWVFTAFSPIVMWYAKGGGDGLSSDTSGVWRLFIFTVIPGYTVGYLVIGVGLLNLIVKVKKSESVIRDAEPATPGNSHPAPVLGLGDANGCSVAVRQSTPREGGCA